MSHYSSYSGSGTYGSSKSRFAFYDEALLVALRAGLTGEEAAAHALAALKARDENYAYVSPAKPPEPVSYDMADPPVKALMTIAQDYVDHPAGEFAKATLIELGVLEEVDPEAQTETAPIAETVPATEVAPANGTSST